MVAIDLTGYTATDLSQLIDAARLRQSEIKRLEVSNETVLRAAGAVDADIAAVMTHAERVATIINAPPGQPLEAVETAVRWLAEALYPVGGLSIRAARLASGRTNTAETLPGA